MNKGRDSRMNGKVTWKWLAIVLAGIIVSGLSWWVGSVWSAQEATETLNYEQQVDIGFLNKDIQTINEHIGAIEKSVGDIENLLYERSKDNKHRDSILQDIAFKVNMMFEGR